MEIENGHKLVCCCNDCESGEYCSQDKQACNFTMCTVCKADDASKPGEKALNEPCIGKPLTRFEVTTGHREADWCTCEGAGRCMGCNLFLCDVCGGAEGSLPTHCPGRKMTSEEGDDVYAGKVDFKDGRWIKTGEERYSPFDDDMEYHQSIAGDKKENKDD